MGPFSQGRRRFLRAAAAGLMLSSVRGASRAKAEEQRFIFPQKKLVRFPEKAELLLITDRPPQLETPLHYFRQDLTPNEAFFVRWHESAVPTRVDLATFRLRIGGNVERPLVLSVDDLKQTFEPVTITALGICSGNSRSLFVPPVPGSQWVHGGMGNARWTGVRLNDLLDRAGLKAGSVEITLQGLDRSPMPGLADFKKALPIEHATDGTLIVAYEMNGAPMPLLNGFPLRLIVPGYYATYWIKSLADIHVATEPLHNIWQDVAYRTPDNPDYNESEDHLAPKTNPIGKLSIHSIFVRPEPGEVLRLGEAYPLEGVAYDAGYGINQVEVSADHGQTWLEARLDPELDRYSWRRWRLSWTPVTRGPYELQVRASNQIGERQIFSQWNHGGYGRKVVDSTTGMVI
jgi:sulfite dehydrogenase (cytochrome) subunit A